MYRASTDYKPLSSVYSDILIRETSPDHNVASVNALQKVHCMLDKGEISNEDYLNAVQVAIRSLIAEAEFGIPNMPLTRDTVRVVW